MNEENVTRKVKQFCDEARLAAAGHLSAIVQVFAEKATEKANPSVNHAKFLLEMLLLELKAEKKVKVTVEDTEESSKKEDDDPDLAQVLLDTLHSLQVDPEEA